MAQEKYRDGKSLLKSMYARENDAKAPRHHVSNGYIISARKSGEVFEA
jgi:hypothetical protein